MNKSKEKSNNFLSNHPRLKKFFDNRAVWFSIGFFVTLIITIVFQPLISQNIANYLPWVDDIKPQIIDYSPSINAKVNNTIKNVSIRYKDNGGSGIDKTKTIIQITREGNRSIHIIGNITYSTDSIIVYEFDKPLKPDIYNVYVKIGDCAGNIDVNNYQFYVLKNPKLNISIGKMPEELKNFWCNGTDYESESIDIYFLNIHNDNETFFENIIFETSFPSVINNYTVFEQQGVTGANVKFGQSNIFNKFEKQEYSSCYLRINLNRISPDGHISFYFIIDYNLSKYDQIQWCQQEVYNLTSYKMIDMGYIVRYNYQEYNIWYSYYNEDFWRFEV